MATSTNGTGATSGLSPKITLYTSHRCPWAHRAHVTLKELGLPYEEVLIDLDTPRPEWYLKINPVSRLDTSLLSVKVCTKPFNKTTANTRTYQRGLVPSIKFSNGLLSDEIITESGIVAQFLADSFPSESFFPASRSSPTSALTRARIAFFVDTWFSKVNSLLFACISAEGEEREGKAKEIVAAVENNIEPLLGNAGPYFNGSKTMTLAEALTAPFLIRTYAWSDADVLPKTLKKQLQSLPNFSKWIDATISQESVTYIFSKDDAVNGILKMKLKLKEASK
ncbi:hypothetical protein MMC09_000719 [Bachmanniomyces sp. S44760]|nr:hypothetical protein [Bachmanniomyces sp. S44760]